MGKLDEWPIRHRPVFRDPQVSVEDRVRVISAIPRRDDWTRLSFTL